MESNSSSLDARSTNGPHTLGPLPTSSELTETLLEAARRVLRRRFRVVLLVRDAYAHLEANARVLTAVWDDLRAALRLLMAWTKRSYRQVSGASLALLVAALIYFVTPIDFVPDPLGAPGFVDDIAVVRTAVGMIRAELDRFRTWEATNALTS